MAHDNPFLIQHHFSRKIPLSFAGYPNSRLHRHTVGGQVRFKNILSTVQSRSSTCNFKTRGLTIADYRARPVISKSRFKPQAASTQNTITSHFSKQIPTQLSSVGQNVKHVKNQSLSGPNSTPACSAQKAEHEIQQPPSIRTERKTIEDSVRKAAAKYNLPTGLITAVIRAESNFQVAAVSRAGAKGLMQLMPATAKELGVTDIFDIDQNIDGGAKYLRRMLDRFDGNIKRALAAYNAGPGTVIKFNGRVPYPETRQYVKRVMRFTTQNA